MQVPARCARSLNASSRRSHADGLAGGVEVPAVVRPAVPVTRLTLAVIATLCGAAVGVGKAVVTGRARGSRYYIAARAAAGVLHPQCPHMTETAVASSLFLNRELSWLEFNAACSTRPWTSARRCSSG